MNGLSKEERKTKKKMVGGRTRRVEENEKSTIGGTEVMQEQSRFVRETTKNCSVGE